MRPRHRCRPLAGQRHFIGTITPSGNTVVERVTLGILRDLPEVSLHFSRTPVFGSTIRSPDALRRRRLLAAARLLAACDAATSWCGTAARARGIGFAHDRALVDGASSRDRDSRHDLDPRP